MNIDTEYPACRAVAAAIERRPGHMRALAQVAALDLPDCWIGAGFVRNAVWDDIHQHHGPTPMDDIDVVYFDAARTDPAADRRLDAMLRASAPEQPWSVKNQARMHARNGDEPYRNTADALTRWPEVCTAVAVRLQAPGVEVVAPLGVRDLLDLVVRPTPHFASKLGVYRERVRDKDWRTRWPQLRIENV